MVVVQITEGGLINGTQETLIQALLVVISYCYCCRGNSLRLCTGRLGSVSFSIPPNLWRSWWSMLTKAAQVWECL